MRHLYNLIILAVLSGLVSCKQDFTGLYTGKTALYFPTFINNLDSTTYSFVGKTVSTDTVFLLVRFLGNPSDQAKHLKLTMDASKTTAKPGDHFEPLKDSYVVEPGVFDINIPIIIKKHEDLSDGAVVLAVELTENEDFDIAFDNRKKARIIFSNIIMKPAIWDGTLAPLFGVYSRTKHIVCMEIMGKPFPQSAAEYNLDRNMWKNWGWICNNYFKDNVVMDNDLNPPARILPWL